MFRMKINIIEDYLVGVSGRLTKQEKQYISVLEDSSDFSRVIKEVREILLLPENGLAYSKNIFPPVLLDAFEVIKAHPETLKIINRKSKQLEKVEFYKGVKGTESLAGVSGILWIQSYMLVNAVCDLFRLNNTRWSDPIMFFVFFNELIINTGLESKIKIRKGSEMYKYFTDPKLVSLFNYFPSADTDIYLEIRGPFTGVSDFIEEAKKAWELIGKKIKPDKPSVPSINKPTLAIMQKIYRAVNGGKKYEDITQEINDESEVMGRFDGIGSENVRQMYKRYKELLDSLPVRKVNSLMDELDVNMMLR